MNVKKFQTQLSSLNELETLGKRYAAKYGKHLNYTQYLLLTRYAKGGSSFSGTHT